MSLRIPATRPKSIGLLPAEHIGVLSVLKGLVIDGTFQFTAEELTQHIDAHPRTILRYLQALAGRGLIVETEAKKRDTKGFWVSAVYEVAPATESALAPATESALAPATESALAPATESALAPATESALAPATESALGNLASDRKCSGVLKDLAPATNVVLEAIPHTMAHIEGPVIMGTEYKTIEYNQCKSHNLSLAPATKSDLVGNPDPVLPLKKCPFCSTLIEPDDGLYDPHCGSAACEQLFFAVGSKPAKGGRPWWLCTSCQQGKVAKMGDKVCQKCLAAKIQAATYDEEEKTGELAI